MNANPAMHDRMHRPDQAAPPLRDRARRRFAQGLVAAACLLPFAAAASGPERRTVQAPDATIVYHAQGRGPLVMVIASTGRGTEEFSLLPFAAAASGPERKTVQAPDATIVYHAQGRGPLVMVIASTGRGTEEFSLLAERLAARGYRVLRPEPRGIGGSVGPMDGVSFHDFAKDFAAVIQQEGGTPAIVAGHAYGNWIARVMATDFPALTRGVVLLAAGARTWPRELSDAITMINDPRSTEAQRLAGLRLGFFAEGNDPRPWLDGWYEDVTKSQRAARQRTRQADWWAGGRAPLLDLMAGADPFRPASSRNELKDEFPDRVTVHVIEGASHALPAEKPLATADAVADWADRLPR